MKMKEKNGPRRRKSAGTTQPSTGYRDSPSGQPNLVELVCRELAPRFAPGAKLIHAGNAGEKSAYFNRDYLAKLGVAKNPRGMMPDVILHDSKPNWLVLVDAVPAHGPINPKRRAELRTIFAGSKAGLVFVTAFLDRKTFLKYGSDISWETEVWIADSPSHLIHFDGERFLGPYPE